VNSQADNGDKNNNLNIEEEEQEGRPKSSGRYFERIDIFWLSIDCEEILVLYVVNLLSFSRLLISSAMLLFTSRHP